jgi:ubiquinone/menaquinone biosynthesis C-methylase UbiE
MRKKTPQDEAGEYQAIKQYYDAFASFYDDFYELINYDAWAKIIQQKINVLAPYTRRILDIGCGTGSILMQMSQPPQRCFGIDISRPMLLQARAKLKAKRAPRLIQGNLFALPIRSNSFETILGNFSLLNIYSESARRQALAEIRRVLKSQGVFISDFFTIHRFQQLLQESIKAPATCEDNPAFKIRQSLLPDSFALQRTLILPNCTVSKRLYFLDPSQVAAELVAASFEILQMEPMVPGETSVTANRLMVIGRKP